MSHQLLQSTYEQVSQGKEANEQEDHKHIDHQLVTTTCNIHLPWACFYVGDAYDADVVYAHAHDYGYVLAHVHVHYHHHHHHAYAHADVHACGRAFRHQMEVMVDQMGREVLEEVLV